MDQKSFDKLKCVGENCTNEYNPYSPDLKVVGEFKDINLNEPGAKLDDNINLSLNDSGKTIDLTESGFKNANYEYQHLLQIGSQELQNDFSESNTPLTSYDKWVFGIAFVLSLFSNIISHLIREPLFTTKVNIQKSFGSSTLQLSYLDISYLTFYAFGHLFTPIAFPRSQIVMFVCFFHFLISLSHFMLYLINSLYTYVIIYGITGFSCSFIWLSVYNDLHSWLPLKFRLIMMTFWLCSAEIGLSMGTIMCAYIQTATRWKEVFLINSTLNLVLSVLLFTCYIKPNRNSEDPGFLENYMPRDKIFDPVNIAKENYNKIVDGFKSIYTQVPDHIELDTLPTTNLDESPRNRVISRIVKCLAKKTKSFFKMSIKLISNVVKGHLDVMTRVKYLNLYTLAYTSLKSSKNSIAFWISFYLTTNLNYSIKYGIYATFVFQMGSCLGSICAGTFSKLVLKSYHLTACTISSAFTFLMFPLIYFMDLKIIWKAYAYFFVLGFSTNCTDLLITTRGLKSLCEQSSEDKEKDYSVSLGNTFSISTFISVIYGYISIYIAHHYGWNYMFLYLSIMMLLSTGAFAVPSRNERIGFARPNL